MNSLLKSNAGKGLSLLVCRLDNSDNKSSLSSEFVPNSLNKLMVYDGLVPLLVQLNSE